MIPRLAWHSQHCCNRKCPPLLLLSEVFPAMARRSTRRGRFSDEPFGVRDIQFDCPKILVEPCPPREEIRDFQGTCRFGRSDTLPAIASVEVEHALEGGDVRAPAAEEQQQ